MQKLDQPCETEFDEGEYATKKMYKGAALVEWLFSTAFLYFSISQIR